MHLRTKVIIRLSVEGLHKWENCNLSEVDYLKEPHRHTFNIVCELNVHHNDRDVEFIVASHAIRDYLKRKYYVLMLGLCNFGGKSCEMLAEELLKEFYLTRCEVNEDGENGAVVEQVED